MKGDVWPIIAMLGAGLLFTVLMLKGDRKTMERKKQIDELVAAAKHTTEPKQSQLISMKLLACGVELLQEMLAGQTVQRTAWTAAKQRDEQAVEKVMGMASKLVAELQVTNERVSGKKKPKAR